MNTVLSTFLGTGDKKALEQVSIFVGTGVKNPWNPCRFSLERMSKILGTRVDFRWNGRRKSLEPLSIFMEYPIINKAILYVITQHIPASREAFQNKVV